MNIVVNGEKKELSGELNLQELLKKLDLPTERVAIEVNKMVIRKKDWTTINIKDADRIEIIHFVGGG
ncbi:MAG: sulfur carrier protein ThiS [Acidobacteriota bacterium]|nr:sulfur carrier protein ThiS [Acidobacteriota bacterium]